MIERKGNIFYGEFRSGFGGNVIGVHGEYAALTQLMTRWGAGLILLEYE